LHPVYSIGAAAAEGEGTLDGDFRRGDGVVRGREAETERKKTETEKKKKTKKKKKKKKKKKE
jgi:hypothetical protein